VSLFHPPICTKCEVEMRPVKNEVVVIDYASYGPYTAWEADEWECPECKYRIITGFANEPYARHDDTDMDALIRRTPVDLLRHNHELTEAQRG
jgi:DNA-directed RNA polymerase subunit RPC12/RpoP